MEELNRAYEALQKAHDAGDVEGAKQIAEYARSLEAGSKADNYAAGAQDEGLGVPESVVGTALGATLGAAAGPAVGATVDTAANIGAKMLNPAAANAANMPESNSPAGVRKWLATQTSNPYAGGKDQGEAYRKAEIAAGKPVQSRGAKTPIRKGNLSIHNQIPETTLPQKAAANIINAEKVGKPGIARRMAGMGVAGAELGNMIEEAKQGHYGHAALSGLGALGGAATQSRIKPIRAIGTGLSMAVPAIQKFVTPDEDEEVQKKAAGGAIQNFESGGVALAKKLVSGYLEHTPKKPNPLVGTRFQLEDLGGVNPVTPLDITKIKNAMLTASPADMTSANQRILNIAGIPMTSDIVTHGGHPFARSKKNIERGHGWASNEAAAGSGQTRANIASIEGEMLGGSGETHMLPMTMGPGSENFSVPVAQSYYDIFKQAEFNPAELKKINEEIRNTKIRKKTPLQGFLGVEHPEAMEQMLKGGYGLEGSHHDLRKAFIDRLQLKDRMRAMGVNQEDIAGAHLDPNLLGVPQGYVGHTVLRSKPGAEILPSDSTTYSHALQKEYMGDIGNTPVSVLLEKPYKNIYQELEAKYPGKTETQIHAQTLGALGKRKAGVSQLVDEETINRVGAYHEAVKQGLIDPEDYKTAMEYLSVPGRYKAGGEVAKKALDLAKETFKKKFTPGFYHGSPDPSITAFDPTKSAKDPMYITPKATFVTRDPEFAESFLSMNNSGKIKSGSTMYPVNVNLGQHWNPNTPEGKALIAEFIEKYPKRVNLEKGLKRGDWTAIENSDFLSHLKDTGHDTFHVMEGGVPNVGVLKPENIRGKFAEFNPEEAASPDFMKAKGGLI
jgi:hypothetical protein